MDCASPEAEKMMAIQIRRSQNQGVCSRLLCGVIEATTWMLRQQALEGKSNPGVAKKLMESRNKGAMVSQPDKSESLAVLPVVY